MTWEHLISIFFILRNAQKNYFHTQEVLNGSCVFVLCLQQHSVWIFFGTPCNTAPVNSHLKYLKVSQCPWKRMSSYQFDQIKSFELDKFQSPAFPSSYLGGNKCSYTLQLDTFCPDWRNWSCFGKKILAVKKKSFCGEKLLVLKKTWQLCFSHRCFLCHAHPPHTSVPGFIPSTFFSPLCPSNPLSSHSSSHSSLLATESYLVWHLVPTPSPPRKIMKTMMTSLANKPDRCGPRIPAKWFHPKMGWCLFSRIEQTKADSFAAGKFS